MEIQSKGNKAKNIWVGLLFIVSLLLLGVFATLLGWIGRWIDQERFHVLYSFAGGVEVGAPVRVSGVKVGKVDAIEFLSPEVGIGKEGATVKVGISVARRALHTIREDSRFFINIAGIIGERYVEISPGSAQSPLLKPGAEVRGVDPPRIDQLLSQGYGVFGRIQDFLDQNEKVLTEFLTNTSQLLTQANSLLKGAEKKRLFHLVENLAALTDDLRQLSHGLTGQEGQATIQQLREMIRRGYQIDKPTLKQFLQEEGIRAKIF